MAADPRAEEAAIEIDGLRKSYGGLEAVGGLSLHVRRGEIFAFLGPNGAGKTTTVEILEGFRKRDAGDVRVLGVDPEHGDGAWRARIGIVLQEGRAQANLTVRETLELWAAYHPHPKAVAETIALVGLEQKAGERIARLSGGQRRRLDVGLALIGDPDLIFLDEPTTAPDRRRAAGQAARRRADGRVRPAHDRPRLPRRGHARARGVGDGWARAGGALLRLDAAPAGGVAAQSSGQRPCSSK